MDAIITMPVYVFFFSVTVASMLLTHLIIMVKRRSKVAVFFTMMGITFLCEYFIIDNIQCLMAVEEGELADIIGLLILNVGLMSGIANGLVIFLLMPSSAEECDSCSPSEEEG